MNLSIKIFLLGIFGLVQGAAAQNENVRLTRIEKNADQYVAAQLLTDIYQRSGLTATIQSVPPRRATQMVLQGLADGEVARISSYGHQYPDLLMVAPAYYYLSTVAYAREPIAIHSKNDLRGYKIGIIRGIKRSEELVKDMPNVERVSDFKSLFLMLEAGRFDVALETELSGSYMIKNFNLKKIQQVAILQKHQVYHILAPHMKRLVPKISAMILALEKTGELEKLKQQYEQEFLHRGIDP
jgi:polar amino acid transport system substrate-binding protein